MNEATAAPSRRKLWPIVATAGLIGVAIVAIAVTAGTGSDGLPRNCNELVPDIIAMSREDDRSAIASIGRVTEHQRTSDSLVCHGSARWQDETSTGIEFYQERHSDGKSYIGYRGLTR